jgi:hypothetical protein
MRNIFFINILFVIYIFVFCPFYNIKANETGKSVVIESDTTWKYLGRPRPGMTPLRFPPDSLLANSNWMWHGTPKFSPDLKEMFWSKYDRNVDRGMLVFVKYINDNWTSMQYAPFGNQNYFESCPFYSYSEDTLFFTSGRPAISIFRTCRTTSGWTEPELLNIPIPSGYTLGYEFSIARNGTLYFDLYFNNQYAIGNIYKSKFINGQYQTPENLGNIINSDSSDAQPYIDPDERFLIFTSKRPGGFGSFDLYISKRNPDSTWNIPINLGSVINTSFGDHFPSVTPDNLYFFYTTAKSGDIGYNPYWISIQYIYNLIAIGVKNISSNLPSSFSLEQNYPNPFNPQTKIKFKLHKQDFVIIKIFDALGREVAALVNQQLKPGTYEVDWDASRFSSGVYFYKLITSNYTKTKKMVQIK